MRRSEMEYKKFVKTLEVSETDEIYGFGLKCYLQGVNDHYKAVEEITLAEIAKRIEDEQFIEYIKHILEHPEEMVPLADKNGNTVEVVSNCSTANECVCFPDRCSALECGDGMCHQEMNIDISKRPDGTYIS